jgi:hypothetical protein
MTDTIKQLSFPPREGQVDRSHQLNETIGWKMHATNRLPTLAEYISENQLDLLTA